MKKLSIIIFMLFATTSFSKAQQVDFNNLFAQYLNSGSGVYWQAINQHLADDGTVSMDVDYFTVYTPYLVVELSVVSNTLYYNVVLEGLPAYDPYVYPYTSFFDVTLDVGGTSVIPAGAVYFTDPSALPDPGRIEYSGSVSLLGKTGTVYFSLNQEINGAGYENWSLINGLEGTIF